MTTPRNETCRWKCIVTIAVITIVAGLGIASDAAAANRLVRVIWDVGNNTLYVRAYERTEIGSDSFRVPRDAQAASVQGFTKYDETETVLRKGDRIRLYVVNYNPVSHVWHESSVVEQIPLAPDLVGPVLNAAVLAITGAAKLPSGVFAFGTKSPAPPTVGCAELTPAGNALDDLKAMVKVLSDAAHDLTATAKRQDLIAAARKLNAAPTTDRMWDTFDNTESRRLIRNDATVFGYDFIQHFDELKQKIDVLNDAVTKANAGLLDMDFKLVAATIATDECVKVGKALAEQRDNAAALMRETAGDESAARAVIATFEAAAKLWRDFDARLTRSWTDDAVEIIVKDAIQPDSVLRIDAEFASTNKDQTSRLQRSVVLGVQPNVPFLVISTGVAANGFKMKNVQLFKTTVTANDGSVSAKNQLTMVDDAKWDRIVPVWIQSLRVYRWRSAGLYGTFGTTPDRNIFRNAIVGGSVVVPRWRTSFTAGVISAKGYDEQDLKPAIAQFSDAAGLALADVTAANLPLPDLRWKRSFYASVTFVVASF